MDVRVACLTNEEARLAVANFRVRERLDLKRFFLQLAFT